MFWPLFFLYIINVQSSRDHKAHRATLAATVYRAGTVSENEGPWDPLDLQGQEGTAADGLDPLVPPDHRAGPDLAAARGLQWVIIAWFNDFLADISHLWHWQCNIIITGERGQYLVFQLFAFTDLYNVLCTEVTSNFVVFVV